MSALNIAVWKRQRVIILVTYDRCESNSSPRNRKEKQTRSRLPKAALYGEIESEGFVHMLSKNHLGMQVVGTY